MLQQHFHTWPFVEERNPLRKILRPQNVVPQVCIYICFKKAFCCIRIREDKVRRIESVSFLFDITVHVLFTSLTMEHSKYLYFAYGSNMCREKMHNRKTFDNSRIVFNDAWRCRLRDWKLCFDVLGAPPSEPAFASIEPSIGNCVYGVTYSLETEQDWMYLKTSEGLSRKISWYGVIEIQVERLDESGSVIENLLVRTLTTNEDFRLPSWKARKLYPSKRYMSILIRGAETEKLPSEYIKTLQSVPTCIPWNSRIMTLTQRLSLPTLLTMFDSPGAMMFSWPYRKLSWRFYAYREAIGSHPNVNLFAKLVSFLCFMGLLTVYGVYAVPGIFLIAASPERRIAFTNIGRIFRQSSNRSTTE